MKKIIIFLLLVQLGISNEIKTNKIENKKNHLSSELIKIKELIKNGDTDIILYIENINKKLSKLKDINYCMAKKESDYAEYLNIELKYNYQLLNEISYINKILDVSLYKELKKSKSSEEFKSIIKDYDLKYGKKCKTNSCKLVFNKYIYEVDNIKDLKSTIKLSLIENLFIKKYTTVKKECFKENFKKIETYFKNNKIYLK
jgi:hypothetical protein